MVTSALGLVAVTTHAAALERDRSDEVELARMRTQVPHAAALLERGEAMAAAGALQQADDLFRQGEAEDRDGSLLWRRDCEALTALGRRDEAVAACNHALGNRRSNGTFRASLRAAVGGPNPTTPAGVISALAMISIHRQVDPSQTLTNAAMSCDLAESLGDEAMLNECAAKIGAIAPGAPETRRALAALLETACPPWRFWGGWLAIVASALFTAWHALRGYIRRPRKEAVALALALTAALTPRISGAAPNGPQEPPQERLSQWQVDVEHPEESIPTEKAREQNPLEFGYWLQDLIEKGEVSSKHNDHVASARFFKALSVAVPDRAIGFVKLCEQYEAMGELEKARSTCGDALMHEGVTVKDYTHFVHLVLATRLEEKDIKAVANVIAHLKQDPTATEAANELECEVAVRTSNVAQLKECTAGLVAVAPDNPLTVSYLWALAVQQNDFEQADKLIASAQSLKVAPETIERMRKNTAIQKRGHRIRVALFVFGVTLLVGGLGAAGNLALRRLRKGKGKEVGPTSPPAAGQMGPAAVVVSQAGVAEEGESAAPPIVSPSAEVDPTPIEKPPAPPAA
jgi:hypothetical protein